MTKYIGNKYGKLVVVKLYDFEILSNNHRVARYLCHCECGKERIVRITSLSNGHTRSCGCSRRDSLKNKNVIDLTGQKFSTWTVLSRHGETKHREVLWLASCICGNTRVFRGRALRSGVGLKCSNCKNKNALDEREIYIQSLIGSRYGRWTVIGDGDIRYSDKSQRLYYQLKCVCDCGTIKDVDQSSLIKNRSTSCGCLRKENAAKSQTFDDLSGRDFGNWTVIYRGDDKFYPGGGRSQMYYCECECGNSNFVARSILISGQSRSCGCLNEYKMESFVKSFLDINGLNYESQVIFDDLFGSGNQHLSYDFKVIFGDRIYLIECQGEQHYKPVEFFGGVERFKRQQKHDVIKRDYAKNNDLILIEIDYKMSERTITNLLSDVFNIKTEKR